MTSLITYMEERRISHTTIDGYVQVYGRLNLRDTHITSWPDNLKVRDLIDLRGSDTAFLPENLQARSIYLSGSNIPVCVANGAGRTGRTIYAFLLGDPFSQDNRPNRVRVTAGCFYGSLEIFDRAVDKKYADSPKEAQEYKNKVAGMVERVIKGDWD